MNSEPEVDGYNIDEGEDEGIAWSDNFLAQGIIIISISAHSRRVWSISYIPLPGLWTTVQRPL